MKHLKGIKRCLSKKVTWPTTQLICLYTSTCSVGSKEEELEAIMVMESHDTLPITVTWWDKSHDWSVAVDCYKLFRRDRKENSMD